MLPTTPRGVNTSEFWVFVAGLVMAAAHAVANAFGVKFSATTDQILMLAEVLTVAYGAQRTWLKIHIPTVGNALPDLGTSPASPSYEPTTAPQPPLSESTPPAPALVSQSSPEYFPPVPPGATFAITRPAPPASGDTPTQTVPTTPPSAM